ncbi:MAG TPA: hypothetical protein VJ872_02690 [Nocardioides sp.]|nr:hypothetical protein [Nocardioides sp.]
MARVVVTYSGPLTNPDTYFHLRLGQEFAHGWAPWNPGHLDGFGTARWAPTQWLSQLGMYDAAHWFGLPGVAVLTTAAILAVLVSWYAAARRDADPLPAVLVTTLALIVASGSLSARPQVLSLLLATWTAMAWRRAADDGRIPWWLIPLGWLWAMLHGMWILGGITSLVLAAGLVADRKVRPTALAVGVASMAVALITPAGPGLVAAVFSVNARSSHISEWATPDFTSIPGAVGAATLGLTVLALARGGRWSWYQLAVVGLSALFVLYSLRTLPIGVSIVLPVLAGALQSAIGSRVGVGRPERFFVGALCVATLAAVAAIAPHRAADPPAYTHDFDDALASLAPGTPVLTEWGDGGPLLWTHPELDFPIHGYLDVYTDDQLSAYGDVFALQPGWDRTLSGLGIRHALLPTDEALTYALTQAGWSVDATHDGRELLSAPRRAAT